MIVTIDQFERLFPRYLLPEEKTRAEALLAEAEQIIVDEFAREGRSFAEECEDLPWLPGTAGRVVREMASASVLMGAEAGKVSGSVSAGEISESGTWADPGGTSWGQMVLTDEQRRRLGLLTSEMSRGSFPPPHRYPERWAR